MTGQGTINVTLGTYGHLFPSIDAQLDEALTAMHLRASPADTTPPVQLQNHHNH